MSTRILAFDTTTALCSVAVMIDHSIYDHKIIAPKGHSKNILPMIHQLLTEVGITLQSLDCIVFNRGPGSFVGVRIGISVAQGLALGADLPLVEVSSLEVLAQGAWRIFSVKQVISTIDARMGELYWAHYYRGNEDSYWVCSGNESVTNPEIIAKKLICYSSKKLQGSWVLVGTGWNNYPVLACMTSNVIGLKKSVIMSPEAQDMLILGMRNWKNKIFINNPNQAQPVYLHSAVFTKTDNV